MALTPPIFLFAGGVGLGALVSFLLTRRSHRHAQQQSQSAQLQEKQALQEQVSQQKTAAFRALFDAYEGGAATLDDEGRIRGSNHALESRLGFDAGALIGRSFLTLVHPEDTAPIHAFLHSLVGRHQNIKYAATFSEELRLYCQNGSILWVHLSLCPLQGADLQGDTPLVLALLDDVTRRREAEGVAARLHAGVHDLYRVIADRESDEHAQMRALLSLGCRLFDVRTGLVGRLDGQELDIMAAISPDSRLRLGQRYALGEIATLKRLELPAPLRDAPLKDWRDHPYFVGTGGETFLGSPIYVLGRFEGLLCFADAEQRETPFEAEQLQFCQLMALWLGAEIERRHRQNLRDQQAQALLQSNAKLEALATQDGLTGLKNRRTFDEKLRAEFEKSQKCGLPLSLLILDVDKFKGFNDSFGHPAGDVVLKQVARLLQDGIRRENSKDPGFVARYGGEEFVVLLPNTDSDAALAVGERLRARIEAASWEHRAVTASFGCACFCPQMTEPAQLLQTADGALYQSKEGGRNRVSLGVFAKDWKLEAI